MASQPDVTRDGWVTACGVRFQLLTKHTLTNRVADAVGRRTRLVVGNHNLHSVHLFHQDAAMKRFFEVADVVHIDGMSLVALARLCGVPAKREHRISYLDWIDELLERGSQNRWRVFFLGGQPGVGAAAERLLSERYPGIVFGHRNGFFDPQDERVIGGIREFQPDVLFVGMGMPRQEAWITAHANDLPNTTILPCGACFDYLTGAVVTPPRWTGQLGVEWLFRLCCEPSRLWRRYLLEPVQLCMTLVTRSLRGSAPTAQ